LKCGEPVETERERVPATDASTHNHQAEEPTPASTWLLLQAVPIGFVRAGFIVVGAENAMAVMDVHHTCVDRELMPVRVAE